MHDRTVSLDRSADDAVVVLEIDDDDFGGGIFVGFLANANEVVGFQCLYAMSGLFSDQGCGDTHARVEAY